MNWRRHPGGSRRRPCARREAAWLRAGGSLSQRLAEAAPPFEVRLLAQGRHPGDQAHWPARPGALHARSVLLCGGGRGLVLARSWTTSAAVHGPWRALVALGRRPLAALLFAGLPVTRSPLQWRWWPRASPMAAALRRDWGRAEPQAVPRGGFWQRWSVFRRQGRDLWVCECFPPRSLRL